MNPFYWPLVKVTVLSSVTTCYVELTTFVITGVRDYLH